MLKLILTSTSAQQTYTANLLMPQGPDVRGNPVGFLCRGKGGADLPECLDAKTRNECNLISTCEFTYKGRGTNANRNAD